MAKNLVLGPIVAHLAQIQAANKILASKIFSQKSSFVSH